MKSRCLLRRELPPDPHSVLRAVMWVSAAFNIWATDRHDAGCDGWRGYRVWRWVSPTLRESMSSFLSGRHCFWLDVMAACGSRLAAGSGAIWMA